jgi:hypothetical protein
MALETVNGLLESVVSRLRMCTDGCMALAPQLEACQPHSETAAVAHVDPSTP